MVPKWVLFNAQLGVNLVQTRLQSREKKDGMVTMCDVGDISTMAARFGNSQASIIN